MSRNDTEIFKKKKNSSKKGDCIITIFANYIRY